MNININSNSNSNKYIQKSNFLSLTYFIDFFIIFFLILIIFLLSPHIYAFQNTSKNISKNIPNTSLNNLSNEPKNLNNSKNNIINYYKNKIYQADFRNNINHARNIINNYLNKNNIFNNKNLAVVFDIDDTLLSTYNCNKQIQFGYSKKHFLYCAEHKVFTPLKDSINFYKDLRKKGIKTFIITGREQDEINITRQNLKEIGIKHWDGLYLKPINYKAKSAVYYKSETRKKLTNQGNNILLSIGDQYSDSDGGYTKYKIKLPNPMYEIK